MFKKTMVASFAMLIAIFAFQPVQQAEAKSNVHIGIGGFNPYYRGGNRYYGDHDPYYSGSDPYYGRDRGYSEPRYDQPQPRYYDNPPPRRRHYGRVNCNQAKRVIRGHGYRRIRAIDCRGKQFKFHAKRQGRWWVIRMFSKNGRMYDVRRLR